MSRPFNAKTTVRASVAAAMSAGALAAFGLAPASAAAAQQYSLNNSQANPTTHCFTGYGPGSYRDLVAGAPTGAFSTTFGGQTMFGCTPALPAGTVGPGTGSIDVWLTNTNKKTCTTPWFLLHNSTPARAGDSITGSGYDGNPYMVVPGGTTKPTKYTLPVYLDSATQLYAGDQLMLMLDIRTSSGSCSNMTLYYGSAANQTDLNLP